jgi:hypothetical protein
VALNQYVLASDGGRDVEVKKGVKEYDIKLIK